jgi:UDP-glucuronate 4-epimerase
LCEITFIEHNLLLKLLLGENTSQSIALSKSLLPEQLGSSVPIFQQLSFTRDIVSVDSLDSIEGDLDAAINEAALPGQILIWSHFDQYVMNNFTSVERLIQHCLERKILKLAQAPTSSVYGINAIGAESPQLRPASPYGVTKLASESLLHAYGQNFPLRYSIVRYFSVFGPEQRPDMGLRKFISAIAAGTPLNIYGDGTQRRDCAFVDGIVDGTISAIENGIEGETYNLAGGTDISVIEMIELYARLIRKEPKIVFVDRPVGDQPLTSADFSKAKKDLKYNPRFSFEAELQKQINWQLG